MVSEVTVEIWFEDKERNWMIKREESSVEHSLRQAKEPVADITGTDCYYEGITKLPIRKSKVKILPCVQVHHQMNCCYNSKINNVHDVMDNRFKFGLTGNSSGFIMPVKIFCSSGSHVTFLEEVRQTYNRYTLKGKLSFKNAVDEYRTLPVKLVRCGRKPWKPVSVFHSSECDRLNWTLLTDRLKFPPCPNVLEAGKVSDCLAENEPRSSKDEFVIKEKCKKHSGTVMRMDNEMSSLLLKHEIDIDINTRDDNPVPKSPRSPKPQAQHNRNLLTVTEHSPNTYPQNIKSEKDNAMTSHKLAISGQENKLERDNIILHFDSPIVNKRRKSVENENSILRSNSPLNQEDDTALPLTAPIIEKDDIDFGCSPSLPRRRKSSERKEHRKHKTEKNELKEPKEHRKGMWFMKNEHKGKTNDLVASTNTATEPKSRFKKQHRKSKSVLVSPTYLTTNTQDKTQTKEKSTLTRKSSLGSSPKEMKTEKTGLFRRFYASPQTDKKFEAKTDELITPLKRTRRYTQPVGDIQKEFIRELKGKLDKYSTSEHNGIKATTATESKDKVVWNLHI